MKIPALEPDDRIIAVAECCFQPYVRSSLAYRAIGLMFIACHPHFSHVIGAGGGEDLKWAELFPDHSRIFLLWKQNSSFRVGLL